MCEACLFKAWQYSAALLTFLVYCLRMSLFFVDRKTNIVYVWVQRTNTLMALRCRRVLSPQYSPQRLPATLTFSLKSQTRRREARARHGACSEAGTHLCTNETNQENRSASRHRDTACSAVTQNYIWLFSIRSRYLLFVALHLALTLNMDAVCQQCFTALFFKLFSLVWALAEISRAVRFKLHFSSGLFSPLV